MSYEEVTPAEEIGKMNRETTMKESQDWLDHPAQQKKEIENLVEQCQNVRQDKNEIRECTKRWSYLAQLTQSHHSISEAIEASLDEKHQNSLAET